MIPLLDLSVLRLLVTRNLLLDIFNQILLDHVTITSVAHDYILRHPATFVRDPIGTETVPLVLSRGSDFQLLFYHRKDLVRL